MDPLTDPMIDAREAFADDYVYEEPSCIRCGRPLNDDMTVDGLCLSCDHLLLDRALDRYEESQYFEE